VSDVFTKAKRSEVMSRIRSRGSESFEVEVVAADAEVFDNVGDDAAGHVAWMPRKRDKPVGAEWICVMPVAPGGANEFATNLTQTTVKLTTVPGRVFAHRSGGENEFVAKGGRDGASGFEQGFQVRLGGLLESKGGLATVAPVRVAAGQQGGFGNPDAVFILTELHFRERNNHNGHKVTRFVLDVKEAMFPRRSRQHLNLPTPINREQAFNNQLSTS
jgi:hypothetical protein